jgi:hypothetical protein
MQRRLAEDASKILMPLAGRSRVDESKCHTGYTGHFSLVGTYSRLSRMAVVDASRAPDQWVDGAPGAPRRFLVPGPRDRRVRAAPTTGGDGSSDEQPVNAP